MKLIRTQGHIFVSALPQESVFANMARRVLKLIREEFDALQAIQVPVADEQATLSLHKLVTQTSESEHIRDYSQPQDGLRSALLDHLQEIETELETSAENISSQAAEHIHSSGMD